MKKFHKRMVWVAVAFTALVDSAASAQTMFQCKDASGKVQFSDRPCEGAAKAAPVATKPARADAAALKAESDARIRKEKALADEVQANRLATEQAGYAAQDKQQQVNRTIADKVQQERTQQRTSTSSSLPADTGAPLTTPIAPVR
ncbi:MAG: DUF4124 domain-containing protein [Burkholderiales bacterium]|nr:DUF4124 domain-containing protein [Burkholderiales bacterium]